jgi:hypothetical protein
MTHMTHMIHMKRWLAVVAVVGALLVEGRAEARLIDLHAGLRGGGITGWGDTKSTPDFFDKTKGPGLGFDLGVKLLVFDLSANFLQVFDGSGRVGTLTQLLLSFVIDVPVGYQTFRNTGKKRNIVRPALGAGVAFGTPGPVHPPLSNDQVSDKGLVTQMGVAYEHFLNPFMGVGVEGDFGYHYFVGGGASATANDVRDHSSGYHLAGFATFTFHLGY